MSLKYEKRRMSYLLGRYVAKSAVASYLNEENWTRIEIRPGVFTQPIVNHVAHEIPEVSLSHCAEMAVAIAHSPRYILGLDIEYIDSNKVQIFESQLTKIERSISCQEFKDQATGVVVLWTVKEALSKALKCGFMTPFTMLEVDKVVQTSETVFVVTFKNFRQYECSSFVSSPHVMSFVLPHQISLEVPIDRLWQFEPIRAEDLRPNNID